MNVRSFCVRCLAPRPHAQAFQQVSTTGRRAMSRMFAINIGATFDFEFGSSLEAVGKKRIYWQGNNPLRQLFGSVTFRSLFHAV